MSATAIVSAWSSGELAGGNVAQVLVTWAGPAGEHNHVLEQICVNDATWHALDAQDRPVYLRARGLLQAGFAADALALVQPYASTWWGARWIAGDVPS